LDPGWVFRVGLSTKHVKLRKVWWAMWRPGNTRWSLALLWCNICRKWMGFGLKYLIVTTCGTWIDVYI
jgi:hypothetical protein